MATVNYSIRGKGNPAKIYIRVIIDKQRDYKLATPLTINPKYFNAKTGKPRKVAELKEWATMSDQLKRLETFIHKQYNTDVGTGKIIGTKWLKDCLNDFFNVTAITDLKYLSNYADHYTEKLKIKRNDKTGQIGVTPATVQKYANIANKIRAFEKHKRRKYCTAEVGTKYRNEFLTYLLNVEKLSRNTAGRYLKFLKTICIDAQKHGYDVSPELGNIKGFTVKVDKIYLNFAELEQIEAMELLDDRLRIARDWLLIGCYIGQRVGDLLSLSRANITQNGNLDFIELVQQKTQKKVSILIHPKVRELLGKYGGNFPPPYRMGLESAKTMFNKHIKEVCRLAGLTAPTEGAKVNPKTNRKENGIFEKWELVTSHICRRSFATNYYGEMPTALIMVVTGHATERQFLEYVGKTNIDYAEQMAKYWNIESQRQNIKEGKQPALRLAK